MKSLNLKYKILTAAILISGMLGGVALSQAQDPHTAQIQARATRIFAKDQAKVKAYPSGQLVALSVAIEFRNYKGAEEIINKLERL